MKEKPVVEIFRTPLNFYLFDAQKAKLIRITKKSFDLLNDILHKDLECQNLTPELLLLKDKGYLSEKLSTKKLCQPYDGIMKELLTRKLERITLQVTQKCNLRCKYCIYSENTNKLQRSHSNKDMPKSMAFKAINFLWDNSIDSEDICIGFYGGEPLLNFPLIEQCVAYAEEIFFGKKLLFTITTNGTLLTDKIIHFFSLHDFMLMVSLDGNKKINDKNRVFANGSGTYDVVVERLKRIEEIEPKLAEKMSISMVLDPQNDFDCINRITMTGGALNSFNISPSLLDECFEAEERAKCSSAEKNFSERFNYNTFLAFLSVFGRFPLSKTSPITRNSLYKINNEMQMVDKLSQPMTVDIPSGTCVVGRDRLLVNVNGDFFPCERVSELSPVMKIGNINDGFNFTAVNNLLNVGANSPINCLHCWCFKLCSLCSKKADAGNQQLSPETKIKYCSESQANAYDKIMRYIVFHEIRERSHDVSTILEPEYLK